MVSEYDVRNYTKRRLMQLINRKPDERRKADLANLRHGIGKSPGDLPELWGLLFEDAPEDMYSKSGEPSYAEWAVYLSLTLYAMHQQGKNVTENCMYKEKQSFGKAMADLIDDPVKDRDKTTSRFTRTATSSGIKTLANNLRGNIQLMNSKGIPLDYANLAGDLYEFQFRDQQKRVRLKWGQDFYKEINKKVKEDKNHD